MAGFGAAENSGRWAWNTLWPESKEVLKGWQDTGASLTQIPLAELGIIWASETVTILMDYMALSIKYFMTINLYKSINE